MNLKDDYLASLAAPAIGQKKLHSVLEAISGTAIGFGISWALLQFIISPLFGLGTTGTSSFLITCIFTIASILRSYFVRRLFNWWHLKGGV